MIKISDFIHHSLDNTSSNPTAVACALVDFSKAFNRIDHNVIVTILSDLNIPTCTLRLITSYLSNRRMCVRYNGATSSEQVIPGGGPQGGLLTVLLFNLQVNLAGAPCPLMPVLPSLLSEPHQQPHGPMPQCHQHDKTNKKKYVDDLSMLEKINLMSALVPSPSIIGPPNFYESSGLTLPPDNSILQHQLADLDNFTSETKMKINYKKTKLMVFNPGTAGDFDPKFTFGNNEPVWGLY